MAKNQEILLHRSSSVYASEQLAWNALNGMTHKKGQPVVAFYTSGNKIGAVVGIGTDNAVGAYEGLATHDDVLQVQANLTSHIENQYAPFKTLFDSMFEKVTLEDGTTAIHAKLGLYSDGFVSAKGANTNGTSSGGGGGALYLLADVQRDTDGKEEVEGTETGAVLMYNGTKWQAVPQNELVPDLTGYATEDYVDGKVNPVSSKVTTLIGNDSGKSARTIAAEEIAAQLVPDDAKDSLDTLAEIAAWIQSHPDDAAAMNVAIENLKKITKHFYNNGSVIENSIKTYIDDAIDALKIGDYAKAADLTALAARVTTAEGNITTLQGRKVSAGDGLNGGGTLGADRTISHKPATGTNGLGLGTIGTGDFISAVERDTYGHLKSATGAKFSDRIKAKSSLGTNEYAVSVASNTTNKGVDLSVVIDVIDGGTF